MLLLLPLPDSSGWWSPPLLLLPLAEEEVAELRTSGPSPAELERPKRLERRPPPPPEPPRSLGSGDMVRDEGRW